MASKWKEQSMRYVAADQVLSKTTPAGFVSLRRRRCCSNVDTLSGCVAHLIEAMAAATHTSRHQRRIINRFYSSSICHRQIWSLLTVMLLSHALVSSCYNNANNQAHAFVATFATNGFTPKIRLCNVLTRQDIRNAILDCPSRILHTASTVKNPSKLFHSNDRNDDIEIHRPVQLPTSLDQNDDTATTTTTTSTSQSSHTRTPKVKQQRFVQSQYNRSKTPLNRIRSTIATSTPSTTMRSSSTPPRNDQVNSTIRVENDASGSKKTMINRDRMWQRPRTSSSVGSIEDLENRLMQRYGNDLSRWTSGDYVDDDDDDDDDNDNASIDSSIQSRPVFDPWEDATASLPPVNTDDPLSPGTDLPLRNPTKSTKQSNVVVSPLSAFGKRDRIEPSLPNGDRNTSRNNSKRIDLSHLITKQPAGGRGTNEIPSKLIPAAAPPVTETDIVSRKQSNDNNKISGTSSRPVLDSNGVPIFLTMDRAQRIFDDTFPNPDDDAAVSNQTKPILSSWMDLGITDPNLLKNLAKMGCESPLPAQRTSCPSILVGTTDVVVGTYTGSGKTLAVLVPIVQRLLLLQQASDYDAKSYVKLIICAPGRELASQIASVTRTLLHDTIDLSVMLAIGGTTFTRNLEHIRRRKPDILIGTPGRLAELIVGSRSSGDQRGRLPIKNLQTIVLDEFDALLSYTPHADPVNAFMESLKRTRGAALQSVLCSATAADMMSKTKSLLPVLEEKYLRPGYVFAMAEDDDILVTSANDRSRDDTLAMVRTTRVSRTVMHGVVHVPHKRFALDTLRRILHTEPIPQQILIFVADSRKVDIVVEKLANVGIIAAPLHGGMGSEKTDRAEVSQALRNGYVGIVVATEMAARGLDAPLLTHVINMDLPTDASHYAHRAGRCGRGGRPGVVINLTTSPQERTVPLKFANQLGVQMYSVEVKNARLNVVDPISQILDGVQAS